MSRESALVDCAREVYEQEKGISFTEDSNHIVWRNPVFDSWQDDIGVVPLQLARPDRDPFKIIKASLYVGYDRAETGIKANGALSGGDNWRFASRFMEVYARHDHDACIAAAAHLILEQQLVIVAMRKPLSGEITKF